MSLNTVLAMHVDLTSCFSIAACPLQPKDRFRWNLLTAFPLLRRFLRSDWWPERINFEFTKYAFAALVALLFIGPQVLQRHPLLTTSFVKLM